MADERSSTTTTTTSTMVVESVETNHDIESIVAKVRGSEKLTLHDFSFVRRLGSGDIGTVYLVELKGCFFAAKMMDREELASRNKEGRAGTEREILEMLDHPFLPFLYSTIECPRWFCLLTEFCPGGDLHILRQRQPEKRFNQDAVRFYASEVIVALEYLHMLGVVYRDLKPENVLVKSDGHIMLTDFDLSLKCDDSTSKPQIVDDRLNSKKTHKWCNSSSSSTDYSSRRFSCMLPRCIVPRVSCLKSTQRRRRKGASRTLKIVAEPIEARSMSFVGTHEYLAPEIVSGEGHGNAVDWWTLGVFIYELLYGVTPFKGTDNEFTLSNILTRDLKFPKDSSVPPSAKDLIIQLLNKDPSKRMGSTMGATALKQHPFFDGVNWALLRCTIPPFTPEPMSKDFVTFNNHDDPFDVNVEYY
ncbi:Kinase superfamily protein [Dorcoceras hygrometricum]|uniref:non-specific serine/threonine protein kinase n=1 Tax=Dorcoceras hygrometricum TaxID=472368 RepID=A0A2Z7D897_9LAMI|nr:Kinase superfamily protein [Dorcoceras hygrometricum]